MSQEPRAPRKRLVDVWTDASWTKETKNVGCAAVVTQDNKLRNVITRKIDFEQAGNNCVAELWGAVYALECQPAGTVSRLFTDSKYALKKIRELKSTNHVNNIPKLLAQRLRSALKAHPDVVVQWKKRDKGKIPIANNFARAAAANDTRKIGYWARKYSLNPDLAMAL